MADGGRRDGRPGPDVPEPALALAPAALSTPAEIAGHPAICRAQAYAAQVLVPAAQQVDMDGLPEGHIAAARAAGLIGLAGPVEAGGAGVPPPVAREMTETLSGACGTTWFVLTQHGTPLAMVERSPFAAVRAEYLRPLAIGDSLAGVAVSHLRRPGPPAVAAEARDGGWRIDGTVAWYTGWGLSQVFLLGAQHGDDHLFFLVDAVEQPGLVAGAELPLAAMGGTHTVALELHGLHLAADRLVDVRSRPEWLADDITRTANVTPAVFGLLRAVLAELETTGRRRSSAEASALAEQLAAEGGRLRKAAYRLVDDVPAGQALTERLRLRAVACELATRAGAALVAAQAGGAMLRSSPAQRWAREALFHQVQAQTADVRSAQLRRYAEVGLPSST